MPYVKVLLTGFGAAIGTAVLWILVSFILPLYGSMLIDRLLNRGGVGAASIGSGSVLLAALIGLLIGTLWSVRRFVVAN